MKTGPAAARIELVTEMHVSQGSANVVDCYWASGTRREDGGNRHRLGFSLSPVPRNFQGRYMVSGCRREAIGRLMFIPSQVPLESSSAGGHMRIAGIHFEDETLRAVSGRGRDWTAHQLGRGINLRSAEIGHSLRRIGHEILSPGFASTALLESLMTLVMIDLDRLLLGDDPASASPCGGGLAGHKLTLLEERIRALDERIPTVAELARLAGFSPRHLLRCYQQETGETLRERLQQESAARACMLLRSTDQPINAISWNLGFSSQGNFTQAFSKVHGEPPSRYRSRFRR